MSSFLAFPGHVEPASLTEGRLTLSSGSPITTTNVTGATTIYFTPYMGNRISLLAGSRPRSVSFTEKSLSVQASLFRIMDVYGYLSAGTLALEQLAWDSGGQTTGSVTGATNATPIVITSNSHGLSNGDCVGVASVGGNTAANGYIWKVANKATNTFELEGSSGNGAYTSGGTWYKVPSSRTTGIVTSGAGMLGCYTKSGDPTRKYLGTYMTTGTSGQTECSDTKCLVWNQYNRKQRFMEIINTSSHSYTTAAWRFFNLDAATRLQFILGNLEDAVGTDVVASCYSTSVGSAGYGYIGAGLNQLSAYAGLSMRSINYFAQFGVGRPAIPSAGWNVLQAVEYGDTAFEANRIHLYLGVAA